MITPFVVAQTRRVVPLLLGDPGKAKTALVNEFGKFLGLPVVTVNVTHYDPAELAGYPWPDHSRGCMPLMPPEWGLEAINKEVVVFLDEITNADFSKQAAVLTLLDRKVGELKMNPRTIIIAAGNPPETAANPQILAHPTVSRMCVFNWVLEDKAWLNAMLVGEFTAPQFKTLPPDWESLIPAMRSKIGTFLMRRQDLIAKIPKDFDGKPFPTNRTWDRGAICMAACYACGLSDVHAQEALAGCVGAGPAAEYFDWATSLDLPIPEEILELAKKKNFQWPTQIERLDQAFVVLVGVARIVADKDEDYEALDKLLLAACDRGLTEAAFVAASITLKRLDGYAGRISKKLMQRLKSLLVSAGIL